MRGKKSNTETAAPELNSPEAVPEDTGSDKALRPTKLQDYVGQADLRRQLSIYIASALHRKEALDHVLLFGPPGLGKTTLAQIIANELGANLRVTSGPVLERPGDLAAILTQLNDNDVLFIDEIHRLPPVVEELLYPAMEDGRLDLIIGEGADAKAVTVPLSPFTLVGATTRAGSLSAPLRDRFGISGRLEYYTPEELEQIVSRSAFLLGCQMGDGCALEVARRARGTPRIANRILRRVRDYGVVHSATGEINLDLAQNALHMLGVDEQGLDRGDRRFLAAINDHFKGGPVGLGTLSVAIGEAEDTLEDAVEPYLIQQGFLQRTPRGRVTTEKGRLVV